MRGLIGQRRSEPSHTRTKFRAQAEAKMAVFEFIEGWYHPRRRHSSIQYFSPIDYEKRHTISALSNPNPNPSTEMGQLQREL